MDAKVYTVLSVLKRMRGELGLEAMLEYLDCYLGTIAKHNPEFAAAVKKATEAINVEKMYTDAMGNRHGSKSN